MPGLFKPNKLLVPEHVTKGSRAHNLTNSFGKPSVYKSTKFLHLPPHCSFRNADSNFQRKRSVLLSLFLVPILNSFVKALKPW